MIRVTVPKATTREPSETARPCPGRDSCRGTADSDTSSRLEHAHQDAPRRRRDIRASRPNRGRRSTTVAGAGASSAASATQLGWDELDLNLDVASCHVFFVQPMYRAFLNEFNLVAVGILYDRSTLAICSSQNLAPGAAGTCEHRGQVNDAETEAKYLALAFVRWIQLYNRTADTQRVVARPLPMLFLPRNDVKAAS